MSSSFAIRPRLNTRIVTVKDKNNTTGGFFHDALSRESWEVSITEADLSPFKEAAEHLRTSDIPVAFPTETVYGLGADATRSAAVRGIYQAKGRPSDNPLIVHICDLAMLRSLVAPDGPCVANPAETSDGIPAIYEPLISRFWPGPLTILLPNPKDSRLAPEVMCGLPTFGVRMPDSACALTLIKLAGVPIAAPSANASTKPSCTTAEHVLEDLDGKIELILDGGPCDVGVESTVVDGLSNPPSILRPGGLSIHEIQQIRGWEDVVKAYADNHENETTAPRAPGMKYKHYSPKAKVVLQEPIPIGNSRATGLPLEPGSLIAARKGEIEHLGYELLPRDSPYKVGLITTEHWEEWAGFGTSRCENSGPQDDALEWALNNVQDVSTSHGIGMQKAELWTKTPGRGFDDAVANVFKIALGNETPKIAQGLFSALRELDQRGVSVIYVEGIEDKGDIAAAVMNRLRKAATVIVNAR